MILWSLTYHGEHTTIQFIENLKTLGFQYATFAGVSLSIDDLSIPPKKCDEVLDAETFVAQSTHGGYRGNRTAVEELQSVIDTWHRTSENVKQHVIDYFEATNILNPVYMMAFSGARGNVSQVRQLVGMRGLMADPKGDIIGFPIRSNFREGLTVTEYMISCYGARKGVVDTALRTADAGYLTRRLVDVSQHMVVRQGSCGTRHGITVSALQSYGKTVLKLSDRLVGRVLATDFVHNGHVVARRNEPISEVLAERMAALQQAADQAGRRLPIRIRSPLTCELRRGVCRFCYGWSLAQNAMVAIGEAVGIIAGQSIGEPGTQLTMRTFHTGGVFTGDVDEEFRTPHGGRVTFPRPFPGRLVRTPYGQIAFLVKTSGQLLITDDERNTQTQIHVPNNTALFVREGEYIRPNALVGLFSGVGAKQNERVRTDKIVFSEMSGQVLYEMDPLECVPMPRRYAVGLDGRVRRTNWLSENKAPVKKMREFVRKNPRAPKVRLCTSSALGTIWVLAGDHLGSIPKYGSAAEHDAATAGTSTVLPMYRISGHALSSHSTLSRRPIASQHDMFVCMLPRYESVDAAPELPLPLMPPGATHRVHRPHRTDPNHAPTGTKPVLKMGYAPLLAGRYQFVFMGDDASAIRIQTQAGDCLELPNKTLVKKAGTFLSFTYLPATLKTDIGGAFWSVNGCGDINRGLGFFAFTAQVSTGVFDVYSWSPLRLSWKSGRRAVRVGPTMPSARKSLGASAEIPAAPKMRHIEHMPYARWVVGGDILSHSITLQAESRVTRSVIYGLLCASHPPAELSSTEHYYPYVRLNSNFVRTPVRVEGALYDLTLPGNLLTSDATLDHFPFSPVPASPPTLGKIQLYPSWLYFPQPTLFGSCANGCCQGFELVTPLQSFVPALLDAQALVACKQNQIRQRTRALVAAIAPGMVTLVDSALSESTSYLVRIRQVFTLRHPELLHSTYTASTCTFVSQAYQAARQMHMFTHMIAPWVSLVQPSTYTLADGATLYFTERFMGWLYVSTRVDAGFVPAAYHQARFRGHVLFDNLCGETLVMAQASLSIISANCAQTGQRWLTISQSLEGAQMHETDWSARPAVWVKQAPTTGTDDTDIVRGIRHNVQRRVCAPPLRRWLRTPTHAVRLWSRTRVYGIPVAPRISLTNPVTQNPFYGRAWSIGLVSLPIHGAAVPGAPNTLYFKWDPILTDSDIVRDAGETFTTETNDVILLRTHHLIAFSLENISETPSALSVGQLLRYGDEIVPGVALPVSGQIVTLTPSQMIIRRAQPVLCYKAAAVHVNNYQWVQPGHPIVSLVYQRLITGDIVQGIPKVEQVFEASRRPDAAFKAHIFVRREFKKLKTRMPPSVAARTVLVRAQRQIVDRIQQIYLSQGVTISDKHFEIVVRQMTSHVKIMNPGITGLFRDEIIPLSRVELINLGISEQDKGWSDFVLKGSTIAKMLPVLKIRERVEVVDKGPYTAEYQPIVLGITAAALNSESLLSSASFQETTRVLSRDAMLTKTDFLRGLKERVMFGDLIPAGTGLFQTIRFQESALSCPGI